MLNLCQNFLTISAPKTNVVLVCRSVGKIDLCSNESGTEITRNRQESFKSACAAVGVLPFMWSTLENCTWLFPDNILVNSKRYHSPSPGNPGATFQKPVHPPGKYFGQISPSGQIRLVKKN